MLGVTSGSLRNSSVAVWEEISPHCWWGGCICVCELWKTALLTPKAMCQALCQFSSGAQELMVQGHVQTPKLDQRRRKTVFEGCLFSLDGLYSSCWLPVHQLHGAGSALPSPKGSICKAAVFQEHMERSPHGFACGCWTKEFRDHTGSKNMPHSLIPWGSLGLAQVSQ